MAVCNFACDKIKIINQNLKIVIIMSCFKRFILLFFMVTLGISLYAQVTVTGKVTDSEGYEVIGGSVVLQGVPTVGTVTDMAGNYSLTIDNPSKAVLVFSYVGMQTQEVKVNGRTVIDVQLKADAVLLDEVVAIGYATVPLFQFVYVVVYQ